MIRNCKACDKEFVAKKRKRKTGKTSIQSTCSLECYLSTQNRATEICGYCSKEFKIYSENQHNKRKYCSTNCYTKGKRLSLDTSRNCDNCGILYTHLQYVKGKYSIVRRKRKQGCSPECKNALHSIGVGPDNPKWTGGTVATRGKGWSSARRRALKRDSKTCQKCGTSKDKYGAEMHVHHKLPYRIGSKLLKDPHKLDLLITLCPTCHMVEEAILSNKLKKIQIGRLHYA